MSSSPGQYYYGELEDNTANGLGFGRFQDGTYIGNWKDGDMDGKGIFLHDDMTVLCGQWRSGKPLFETDGVQEGVYQFAYGPNKDGYFAYSGEMNTNKETGEGLGIIYFRDSKYFTYIGEIRDNEPNGFGFLQYSDGEIYIGRMEYVDHYGILMHGEGLAIYKDGMFHYGNFYYGKVHGKGVFVYDESNVEEGDWEKGDPGESIIQREATDTEARMSVFYQDRWDLYPKGK
jgi:hypothetical protein